MGSGAEVKDFYSTPRWKKKRAHILRRDGWLDQVALREGVKLEADTVHHILRREDWPQYQWCDWNLISVNGRITHKARLHEKYTGKLTKLGKELAREVMAMHGIKAKTVTLVIGMPGSGKSTWTREHMGGGLVYELDAIASAFRLSVPHKGEPHAGARRMAAALRSGWLAAVREYTDDIYIVRTAPSIDELAETQPDRMVVCTHQYVQRPYRYDPAVYQQQINACIDWAQENGVEIIKIPQSGE